MKRVKLYEQMVDKIRERIAGEIYRKGDMLPSEKDFIDEFQVSRTTVREALRMLSEAGVSETRQGTGSVVLLDAEDFGAEEEERKKDYQSNFAYTTQARLLLEPEVARLAALEGSEEAKARINRCLEEELRRSGKKSEQAEAFHRSIFQATENPFLMDLYEKLLGAEANPPITSLVAPNRQKSVQERLDEQHRKVNEAIQNGDGEFAYFYMKEHTLYIKQVYSEYFAYFYSR